MYRDIDFYNQLTQECLTPDLRVLLTKTIAASVEASFKQHDITPQSFDPIRYHWGACNAIMPEIYVRMDELVKTAQLPTISIVRSRAEKNYYPYPEYVLCNKLIFHIKKAIGAEVPDWASFRENRSNCNQARVFRAEDIPEIQERPLGLPFALLTYDFSPAGLASVHFGYPRSKNDGTGWIGQPIMLSNMDLERLEQEQVSLPKVEFNKEALQLRAKSS